MSQAEAWRLVQHPIVGLFLTFVAIALALSGVLNVWLARCFWFAAWCVAMFSVSHTNILPTTVDKVGMGITITVAMGFMALWMAYRNVATVVIDRYKIEKAYCKEQSETVWWWAMHFWVLNDSKSNQAEPIVTAQITFYSLDGPEAKYLFHMPARWARGKYPKPSSPKADISHIKLRIGDPEDIDICLKFPGDADFFGVNNDSFEKDPDGIPEKLNKLHLEGRRFLVEVRLRGVNADHCFRLRFKNDVGGGFTDLQAENVNRFKRHLQPLR